MAKKKKEGLQSQNVEDLKASLNEKEALYMNMKFEHAVKGLGNPLTLREERRNIARIHTELRSREITAMDDAAYGKRSRIRARRSQQKKG